MFQKQTLPDSAVWARLDFSAFTDQFLSRDLNIGLKISKQAMIA